MLQSGRGRGDGGGVPAGLEEEAQEAVDAGEETGAVMLRADVVRGTGEHAGAVEGEHQESLASGEGGAGEADHVGKAMVLGGETQAFKKAEAGEDAGHVKSGADRATEVGVEAGSDVGEGSCKTCGQGEFDDAFRHLEGMRAIGGEVASACGGKGGVGDDATVHLVAEACQEPGRVGPDAVRAGPENAGLQAERVLDGLGQAGELAVFEAGREIAGIGVPGADGLLGGRVDPGVEVSADLAACVFGPGAEEGDGIGAGGDGVVYEVGGDDPVTVEDSLECGQTLDVLHRAAFGIGWLVPVEFFLGIDDDEEGWRPARGDGKPAVAWEQRLGGVGAL